MKRPAMLGAALVATALCGLAPAAMAAEGDEGTALERVSAYVQPSVVYLQMDWTGYVYDTFNDQYLNNERPFQISTQCTGYAVNPDGYIATAGHCVDPKGDIQALFAQHAAEWAVNTGYYADGTLTVDDILAFDDFTVAGTESRTKPDRDVTAVWSVSAGGVDTSDQKAAQVVKFQPFDKGDGAIIKIESSDDMLPLPLSDTGALEVGTEVVSIGYPVSVDLVTDPDLTPSFKEGSVSAEKTVDNGISTVYEISAAMSGGMSGGPTVDLDGQVIGFNSYGINGSVETQQFNFVRPSDTIAAIMSDIGVENDLGDIGTDYREGLDAYFAGDKAAALENLEAVVDAQPTNAFAQEYLDKAEGLPDPAPAGDDGLPVLPIVIGGAAVLLIAVGVLVLMMRRRGSSGGQGGVAVPVAGSTVSAPMGGPGPQVAPTVMAQPAPTATTPPPAPEVVPPAPVQAQPVAQPQAAEPAVTAPPVPPAQPAAPVVPHPEVTPPPAADPVAPVGFVPPEDEEPAPVAQEAAVYCTRCGAKGSPGQAFCGSCGNALS